MILSINQAPSISSYVQHSYTNAIIESRELLIISISDLGIYNWKVHSSDIEYRFHNEYLHLSEKNSHRLNTKFTMCRKCENNDEIIIKTEYIKKTDNMASLELFLLDENHVYKDDSIKEFIEGVDSSFRTANLLVQQKGIWA